MRSLALFPLVAVLLTGCAITTEGSLNAPLTERPDTICIVRNPAVAIVEALGVFQQSLKERGVNSVVCDSKEDCRSSWRMTYVLTRRWDMVPYLANGHMELYKNDELISSVDFSGGWGLNFAKYGHTRAKLDGMIGALLGEKEQLQ